MNAKMIIGICLVVFIVAGLIILRVKNKKKFKGEKKLKLKKYDPVLRKHVLFEEKKLSKLKKKAQKESAPAEKKAEKTEK